MRIDVVTLFPELFEAFLATSMIGRGVASGAARVRLKSPRDFGLGRHKSVDDTPYGGGSGMVMRVDCLVHCLEALDAEASAPPGPPATEAVEPTEPTEPTAPAQADEADVVETSPPAPPASAPSSAPSSAPRAHRVLLCPQGAPFRQRKAQELVERGHVALVCGRYEGFDDRVRAYVDEEISLGDFVLSGGEVAAMAVIDACVRLLPGVLGNAASAEHESHSPALGGLLEYPQFTRPVEYRGVRVPDVLQNGNHAAIDAYRLAEAERRTRERRPDLWAETLRERAARAPAKGRAS